MAGKIVGSVATPASTLVRLIAVLFLALLAEGAFRKWIFPNYHHIFYLLRDPIVIGIYFVSLPAALPNFGCWGIVWAAFGFLVVTESIVQFVVTHGPIPVMLLGIRNYFLYMPLAFVIAALFGRADVLRLAKVVALSAVPVALVNVLQFGAPPGSWLNVGAGGSLPPRLAGEVLRTTGFLASDAQHAMYIAFSFAASLALMLSGSRRDASVALTGIAASVVMMIVSGSRGVWMLGAVILLAGLAAAVIGRGDTGSRWRGIAGVALTVALVAGLLATALRPALEAYEKRNEEARTFSYATIERIVDMFVPDWLFEESAISRGIGMTATGAVALQRATRGLVAGETDIDRNIAELGVLLGLPFVMLRYTFAAWLGLLALRAARRGRAEALAFAAYAIPQIAVGQITMHTVYAHLAWMAAGLAMAAARSSNGRRVLTEGPPAPSLARASLRLAALRSRGLRLSARRVSL